MTLTAPELEAIDARVRHDLARSRWRIAAAYIGITVVFVLGLWSYRNAVDRIQAQADRQAVKSCLAQNEVRREVIHLGDVDPRIAAYLERSLPLDDCAALLP